MNGTFKPKHGWGPQGRRAALCVTFDNFGEAADIEHGIWGNQPVGQHYTAAFLPKLIEALADIRATYFIEASNAALYPDALRLWQSAGHEVAIHAWRHEVWERCEPARRRTLLADSLAAMRSIGVRPIGFRPPGGAIPPEAWGEFEDAGLLYCSPLGEPGIRKIGGMLSLPFEWHGVDAYMIEEIMGFMRVRCGDQETPFGMDEWRAVLDAMIEDAIKEGCQRTIIFHPHFLALSEEKLNVVRSVLARAREAELWIAPAGEVARFVAAEMGLPTIKSPEKTPAMFGLEEARS